MLAVEVVADCRGALLPDPKHDAVRWGAHQLVGSRGVIE